MYGMRFVNKDGTPVTNPSSYTRFCDKFIHSTKKGMIDVQLLIKGWEKKQQLMSYFL